jgi:hypothetical protein
MVGTTAVAGDVGTIGTEDTYGADGVTTPLSATAGLTPLPTTDSPTVVINLTVPAGNYVVEANTQLSQPGGGNSIDCALKAGETTIDQISIETQPELAAIPVSMRAVTTTSPTQLSVECDAFTLGGAADFSSLIATPTG